MATHLLLDTWTRWQEEQVVTTLKNTICGTGNHMSNVEKKIQKNFVHWLTENGKNKTGSAKLKVKDIEEYMREIFQIHNKEGSDLVGILDIFDTMIAPDIDASLATNGVWQNVLACHEEVSPRNSTNQVGRKKREDNCAVTCSNTKFTPMETNCFYTSSTEAGYTGAVAECLAEEAQLATITSQ